MSFTSIVFPFSNGTNNPSVTQNDVQIQNSDPGLGFSGQESGGIYVDTREVAGSFWVAQNAIFNKTSQVWQQILTGQPSYATQYLGGYTLNWYSAALGGTLPTITWVAQMLSPQYSFMRNRAINGQMEIDQRNNGAAITPVNGQYSVDRWKAFLTQASKFSLQQIALAPSLLVPAAFALRATSLSSYSPVAGDFFLSGQPIEAINIQDYAWGTTSALPITVSFLVRCSTAGTYNLAFGNAAATRSYVATFTIATPNVFQLVTVSIPGDTTGTWILTGNAVGLYVYLSYGIGSTFQTAPGAWVAGNFQGSAGATNLVAVNGATLDFTNFQVETGPINTPFERRLYGAELDLCFRYCYNVNSVLGAANIYGVGWISSPTNAFIQVPFQKPMRVAPTLTVIGPAVLWAINWSSAQTALTAQPAVSSFGTSPTMIGLACTVAGGLTAGQGCFLVPNGSVNTGLTLNADF